ncbi:MAG TPA: SusC/RagA family TonB-linked outer membrane protein [Dinghuibacter sp.]|uniref:SusC/RagA family TonB-linked outer membrane protein n=1 Tax=Dinghuibacter sp. TaxID=2024697 RepID=UPI002C62B396|nr:SusC/RagA family TonB-linked outer membrane protein [Dinghuibacter sp.]HTJ13981.1 SusC/RagA family TonB-linked outer membrane protein [Dinghuibacter sp.]
MKWTAIASLAILSTIETPYSAHAGEIRAVFAAKPVKGIVRDENGQPLANVTVTVKGTTRGTTTDEAGNFTINAEPGDVLVFSSIGTDQLQQKVGKGDHVLITLSKKDKSLDEVVVVGYGQAKSTATAVGNLDMVSSKQLQEKPVADVLDAVQGRVPGLSILSSTGEPNGQVSVSLNGVGSLTADVTPLIILDGVQVAIGTLLQMNPNDIADMTILKDAASTSIYGARAANGVIMVTTKKGTPGRDNITLRTQYGVSNIADTKYFKSFMSSDELANFQVAQFNAGTNIGYDQHTMDSIRQANGNVNTEWWKYYYKKNSPVFQQDLVFSGGTSKTQYYIDGSWLKDQGVAYRSEFNRYTLRANITSKVTDWATVGVQLGGGYSVAQTNPSGSNSTNRGLFFLAPSYYSPINPATGQEYVYIPGWNHFNPKYRADQLPNPLNQIQLNPTGFLEIRPLKGLTFRSTAGMDAYDYRNESLTIPSQTFNNNSGSTYEEFDRETKLTINNTLEYQFKIKDQHTITALAGQEYIDDKYSYFNASSADQSDARLTLLQNGTQSLAVNSDASEYNYISYFGRLSYSFRDKYNLDLSIRNDASSRFGADVRNALFGAAGIMWWAKKESFLSGVKWLTDIQVRASLGTQGNSAIGNYQSLALVGSNTYNGGTGFYVSAPGNPDLTWEKVLTGMFGATFTLFDRAHFDLAYFNKHTKSMLVSVPYAYTSGFANIEQNVGTLLNQGLDAKVNIDIVKTRKLWISPFFTATYVKEKVTSLFQGLDHYVLPGYGFAWIVGKPVMFVDPIFAGVNPQDGNPQWYVPGPNPMVTTKDPKNVTENYDGDLLQQNTGHKLNPPFYGGFGVDATWKGFALSVQFSFYSHKIIINNDEYFYANPNLFGFYNQAKEVQNYWKKPGDIAQYPSFNNQTWTQFDNRLEENASFMRMKVATLSYNLPHSILEKTKVIQGIKLYVTGRNLLTFTKYPGVDPEPNSNLELGSYPNTKQIVGGLDVTF